MVDDVRANTLGGLSLSFLLWKASVLPMLLSGAECGVGVRKKTLNDLEKLQLKLLRVCLAVGKGTPKAHLYAQTGTWTISNQVVFLKLRFLHHVATLPIGSLARDVYQSKLEQELPGLVTEMKPLLDEFQVTDITSFSKNQWKRFLEDKLHSQNAQDIIKMARSCKYKIDIKFFEKDDFKM